MVDVIVVGAGISGLSCAHALERAGVDVLVLESSRRAGGVMETLDRDGFLFEAGPNTVPATAANFRTLCGELGIGDSLIASNPEAKRRYLFFEGALRELPTGIGALLTTPLLSFGAKLRMLSEPLRSGRRPSADEEEPDIEAFLTERIGREATRTLAGSFVRGVYAAEIEELGARSAFPRLWDMAASHGSLVRGMFARRKEGRIVSLPGPDVSRTDLLSFRGGLQVLVDALVRALGKHISTNSPVADVERGAGGWRVSLESGESLACNELVLAVPAPIVHPLLAMCAPERLELDALSNIDHGSITVVHLGLEDVTLPPGFGYLVPPDEEAKNDPKTPRVLGTLFTSQIFSGRAPTGTTSITAMYRGADVESLSGSALVDGAVDDLVRAVAPSDGAPILRPRVVASAVQRWREALPRYGVGHERRIRVLLASMGRTMPGVHLAGNYVGGVSVDDCIRHGRRVAERVRGRLAGRPGPTEP